jgi:hypothetical protein
MPNDNHVSFVTDDEPDTPEAVRLHVMAHEDYYLAVSRTKRWPMGDGFRHCLSGSRHGLLGYLIAAIYKLGKGDYQGAILCAETFAKQAEVERTL